MSPTGLVSESTVRELAELRGMERTPDGQQVLADAIGKFANCQTAPIIQRANELLLSIT